jgi:hypothetical protein
MRSGPRRNSVTMRSLGGRMDFGAVTVDPDEPVFRARWEAAVIAAAPALLTAAPARGWNQTLSSFRYARERIDPVHHLAPRTTSAGSPPWRRSQSSRGCSAGRNWRSGRAAPPRRNGPPGSIGASAWLPGWWSAASTADCGEPTNTQIQLPSRCNAPSAELRRDAPSPQAHSCPSGRPGTRRPVHLALPEPSAA